MQDQVEGRGMMLVWDWYCESKDRFISTLARYTVHASPAASVTAAITIAAIVVAAAILVVGCSFLARPHVPDDPLDTIVEDDVRLGLRWVWHEKDLPCNIRPHQALQPARL